MKKEFNLGPVIYKILFLVASILLVVYANSKAGNKLSGTGNPESKQYATNYK